MNRMTYISEERALIEFAEKAAADFKANPRHATYGINDPTPGEYLALRWGMGEDCVLVVKLDADFQPVNFQQAVREAK